MVRSLGHGRRSIPAGLYRRAEVRVRPDAGAAQARQALFQTLDSSMGKAEADEQFREMLAYQDKVRKLLLSDAQGIRPVAGEEGGAQSTTA